MSVIKYVKKEKNLVSKIEGKVQVKSIKEMSREEWIKKISKPTVVQVAAKKIEPKSVVIVEG